MASGSFSVKGRMSLMVDRGNAGMRRSHWAILTWYRSVVRHMKALECWINTTLMWYRWGDGSAARPAYSKALVCRSTCQKESGHVRLQREQNKCLPADAVEGNQAEQVGKADPRALERKGCKWMKSTYTCVLKRSRDDAVVIFFEEIRWNTLILQIPQIVVLCFCFFNYYFHGKHERSPSLFRVVECVILDVYSLYWFSLTGKWLMAFSDWTFSTRTDRTFLCTTAAFLTRNTC